MVHWNPHLQPPPPPTPEGAPQNTHSHHPPPSHLPPAYRPHPPHPRHPESPSSPDHAETNLSAKRARAPHNGSPPPRPDPHSSPQRSYNKPPTRRGSSPMRPARPYSDEAPVAHSPGVHGASAEPHRGHRHQSPDFQRRRSEMDGHAAPYATTPHTLGEHMREQQMHNVTPPGHVYGPHIDTSVGPSYGPHSQPHSAPPYPQPYPYGAYDTPNGIMQDSSQKRKAVRASQACDNCRAKKAKCDENKPCGNCVANSVQCHFRDVQPPKQERSMLQLNDTVGQLSQGFQSLEGRMQEIQTAILSMARRLDNTAPGPTNEQGPKDSYYSPPSHVQPMMRPTSPDQPVSTLSYSEEYNQAPYSGHTFKAEPNDSKRWNQTDRSPGFVSHPASSPQLDNSAQIRDHEMQQDLARRREEAQMDMLNGNVSLAPRHFTAANNLSAWPSISPSFHGVAGQDYVKRGEHYHSLCLRSVLQRAAKADAAASGSPATHSEHDDSSSVSNVSDGRPAMAFVKQGSEGSRGLFPTPGGRNPRDQSLSIDKDTSYQLLQSYFDKIHILQPFLSKNHVNYLLEQFVSSYCSEPGPLYSPFAVIDSTIERPDSGGPSSSAKRRKYSQGPGNDSNPAKPSSSKIPIERTVENALILLIFALGKACTHQGPLPALTGEFKTIPAGTPVPSGVTCTPVTQNSNGSSRRGSPALVTASWSQPSDVSKNRKSNEEYHATSDYRGSDPYSQDIDRVPGLAYYIHAVQILGEVHGENSLTNVQAQLLAGLYMAQLLRVNDSYKWICSACMTWQMLFKQRDEEVRNTTEEERTTFWACLVLESDIVAEVDCVQSGISKWEDQMRYPKMEEDLDPDELDCKVYFLAQIAIRKILNRAHSALHTLEEDKQKNQEWQRLSSQDLTDQLEAWRRGLPSSIQWEDNAPLASTINGARLRDSTPKPQNRRAVTQDDDEYKTQFDKQKEAIARAVQCIETAKASTVAFDGIPTMRKRLISTNPFGTAQAQFSNILVLTAAFNASSLRGHIQQHDMLALIDRTTEFTWNLSHLSPTMNTNLKILERCRQRVLHDGASVPSSAYNSFSG